jgi:hypothetical protein
MLLQKLIQVAFGAGRKVRAQHRNIRVECVKRRIRHSDLFLDTSDDQLLELDELVDELTIRHFLFLS